MDIYADVVIVGTGVGGLFAALNIEPHKKVVLITKSDMESSDSFLAQGGICDSGMITIMTAILKIL